MKNFLIILGFPLWLPLLIAAFAVIISLYAVLWSLLIALFAVFVSLAVTAPYGIIVGIWLALGENALSGMALIGAGFVCAGLAILCFLGFCSAVKGAWAVSKAPISAIKNRFV